MTTRTKLCLIASWASFLLLWSAAPFPGWELHIRDWRSYAALVGSLGSMPRPGRNVLLEYVLVHSRSAYLAMLWSWVFVLLSLPFLLLRFPVAGGVDRWRASRRPVVKPGKLPPYPVVSERKEVMLVVGEKHYEQKMIASTTPEWLSISRTGLYLGTLIMGASGFGKSRSFMLPAAQQLFGYRADDSAKRCGGLVLEAKGTFCTQVRDILFEVGRREDYIEIGPESDRCYNPLYNDTDPTELAFDILAMIKNLSGDTKNESRFWDEAAESMISFLIQIYRLLDGYVTLRDVYIAAMDRSIIDSMMERAEDTLNPTWVLIDKKVWMELPDDVVAQLRIDAGKRPRKWDNAAPHHFRSKGTPDLIEYLKEEKIPHSYESEKGGPDSERQAHELESVRRSYKAMKRHKPELFDTVCYGLQVALEITEKNQEARRVFCPPPEAYDPVANADFKYGRPLAKLEELIETPAVICLRMPITGDYAKLARVMGTLLKQNWQRATVHRIPNINADSRSLVFLVDEYHLLVTTGGSRSVGDDKFFTLAREGRCIPVMAIPCISALRESLQRDSWKALIACPASVICLRQNDQDTAEHVSKMAGNELQWRQNFSMGEGNADPVVSPISGGVVSEKRSVSLGHSVNSHMEPIYQPKVVRELPIGVAIAMICDGARQLPPTFAYLKMAGADPNEGYFA